MTRDDMEHAMTAAGIALIAGGLAILVGFRHLLWGSGKSRRRGRASAAAIGAGPAAATGASSAGMVESAEDTVTTMQAPLLLSTVTGVPQPRTSRRSRRRMASVGARSGDSSGDLGGDEPVSPAPSGLACLGLADEDEELAPVSPAPTDHDPGEFFPVDVEGVDFEGVDFEGVDVEGADVEGADVEGVDFVSADFVDSEFDPADLHAAGFDPADFEPLDPDPESFDHQSFDPEQANPGLPGPQVPGPGSLDPELAEFAELGTVQFGPAEAGTVQFGPAEAGTVQFGPAETGAADGSAAGTPADGADDDLEPAGYAMARSRAGFSEVCSPSGYTEAAFVGPVFVGPDRGEGGAAAGEPRARSWTPVDDHAAWRPADDDDSPWRPTTIAPGAGPLVPGAGPLVPGAGPVPPGPGPVAASDVPEWPLPSPVGRSGEALIRMAPEWQTPTAGWPAPDTSGVWVAGGRRGWTAPQLGPPAGCSQDDARVAPETASLWATPEHTSAWAAPEPAPVPADPDPAPAWPTLDSASGWAASETTSGWVRGTWAASEPKGPWTTPDPAELDAPRTDDTRAEPIHGYDAPTTAVSDVVPAGLDRGESLVLAAEPADTAAAAAAIAAAVHNPADRQHPAEPDADRTGQHFPRRSRAATVRRTVIRPDAAPAAEQPSRQRVAHPRAEARRRLAASATEVFPAVSDVTQILPAVPVIEGYGSSDGLQRDGRQGTGRAENGRSRDSDAPARPRPRPRPRSGGQPGDDRQPSRSTVYVSRHAAEPS